MSARQIVTLSPDCAIVYSHDLVLLLPKKAEIPLVLRGSAHEIWMMLGRGLPLDDVASTLAERDGAEVSIVLNAIHEFVDTLVQAGAVVVSTDGVDEEEAGGRMHILTVCTGNICRSLFAERALTARLGATANVTVSSAGTQAQHGLAVPDEVWTVLRAHGLSVAPHEPQSLSREMVMNADLVLAATVAHREVILRMVPTAFKKVFTILEASAGAKVASRESAPTSREGVQRLASARSAIPGGTALDVEDPFRRGTGAYAHMEGVMWPALDDISRFLQDGTRDDPATLVAE